MSRPSDVLGSRSRPGCSVPFASPPMHLEGLRRAQRFAEAVPSMPRWRGRHWHGLVMAPTRRRPHLEWRPSTSSRVDSRESASRVLGDLHGLRVRDGRDLGQLRPHLVSARARKQVQERRLPALSGDRTGSPGLRIPAFSARDRLDACLRGTRRGRDRDIRHGSRPRVWTTFVASSRPAEAHLDHAARSTPSLREGVDMASTVDGFEEGQPVVATIACERISSA